MKVLIIGIDSLGFNAIEKLNLHFIESLSAKGVVFNPRIDNNVSRGWVEIYTGKTAYETGAFYLVPIRSGSTIKPLSSTGLSHVILHINECELLWHKINQIGFSFGVFNVNTVDIIQHINGFMVLGAMSSKLKIDIEKDVYPNTLMEVLRNNTTASKNIDFGFRLGYGAYIPKDENEFYNKALSHIDSIFKMLHLILNKQRVDFLFSHFPLVSEIMFKFASLFNKTELNPYESKLKRIILDICSVFQEKLKDFVEFLDPKHIFIVSDHGSGALEYHININELLCNIGVIKKNPLKSMVKKIFVKSKNIMYNKNYAYMPSYNFVNSLAFSIGYTDLIYINDERFLGKYMPLNEVWKLSKQICEDLQAVVKNTPLQGKIKFEPLELPKYTTTSYQTPLPNIRIYMEDTFFNSLRTEGNTFIKSNVNYEHMFKKGFYGEFGGWRAQDTFFSYIGPYSKDIKVNSLTDIYNAIIYVAEREKKYA
ncbi:MAG: hypothetical protein GXO18_05540 [Aquificae bacterium]|nr:hypothetical protein [Aquificota bacterium]